MNETNQSFNDVWNELQKNIANQIQMGIKNVTKQYEDISTKWLAESEPVNKLMTDILSENKEPYLEIYNVWKNYQNKINARMIQILEGGNAPYVALEKMWTKHAENVIALLDSKSNGGNECIYTSWSELTSTMMQLVSDYITESRVEYQALNDIVSELKEKMDSTISNMDPNLPHLGTIERSLREMYSNLEDERNANYGDVSRNAIWEFQKSWFQTMETIRKSLMGIGPQTDYDKLYASFFDASRWTPFNSFTASTSTSSLEDEVNQLRAQVNELEKKLKKKSKESEGGHN
ncbi:MAG: hypothetical protein KKH41_01960 [Candidatus Thermoplasmatota archaeon]|nr:hypothetical protein [Euryarchaeota archaeon]MBU4031329.1 hypothetical protein [Candidatus Thermoplasmatota archaeon]MBU4071878.1 hypothetical protein [Candidatus Thermoplasmatota archaeon]MBU4144379.1 hypothetical protein [Candidatus Thermoplasmatota archaeon]MBU4591326.1 hypothetical protein [Candidatus Thermoplasmatota archaeon]